MALADNPIVTRAYAGRELPMFLNADNFHRYQFALFGTWLRGDVLEVGAGLGALTGRLLGAAVDTVTVCDLDAAFVSDLAGRYKDRVRTVAGGIRHVPDWIGPFDAILYVDVLEHVEDDKSELATAAAKLKPGGHIIIAGPAHQWLYSEFDAALGHFRRYDRGMVEVLVGATEGLRIVKFVYFDSLGMLLSLGNRWLGRQSLPSRRQVMFWDRVVLPLSRRLDPAMNHRVGKSFVAAVRKVSMGTGLTR